MLPYFPEPHKDELLYSVLARQCRHTGCNGPGASMLALFGRRATIAAFDLPGHLQALADRIDGGHGDLADRLIDRATLLPYYTAFQPAAVAARARSALLAGAADVHVTLGIAAFGVARPARLRFCPDCLGVMGAVVGETYWRRSHQLPGVLVCPDHGCSLHESRVTAATTNRHMFVPCGPEACPAHGLALCSNDDVGITRRLVEVAVASASLLVPMPLPLSYRDISDGYRSRLADAGLMRSRHKVDQAALADAVRDHYGEALELLVPKGIDEKRTGWPACLTRSKDKAHHPLHHLLLNMVLDSRPAAAPPFGPAPWPCRNPLEAHCGTPTIETVQMHRNRLTTVGTFACQCGYAYTRCLYADGRVGPPRLRSHAPSVGPVLCDAVKRGESLRGLARSIGADPKTVVRLLALHGIPTSWKSGPVPRPARGVTMKAAGGPAAVAKVRLRPSARIDWEVVDRRLVAEMKNSAAEIRLLDPPVRVTKAELERWVGRRNWLGKRRHVLPGASRAAIELGEGLGEYRRRRVISAIQRLQLAGKQPVPWRVRRLAGLRGGFAAMIDSEIVRAGDHAGKRSRQDA